MISSPPGYTIVRELGSGGSATVYLAVQERLNRRVALKVLGRGLATDRNFNQRFLREARIVARLSHPNIVPVFDVGEHDGMMFMAMEYVGGGSLAERPNLTVRQGLECLLDVCSALEYAHAQGFVHRDIKPDNMLFRSDGGAMLADFGVARAAESLTQMTVTGAIIGTPAYMSPEQVAGSALDGRADLYSIGVVLYELLAGYRPFAGDSVMSVGLQHMTAPVPPLPASCEAFAPIVERLLAKEREARYPDARTLAADLMALRDAPDVWLDAPLEELHSSDHSQSVSLDQVLASRDGPDTGRRRLGFGAAAAAIVAVGGLAGAGWWFLAPQSPRAIAASPVTIESSRQAAGMFREWLEGAEAPAVVLSGSTRSGDGGYTVSLGQELDFAITSDRGGALMMIHLGADDAVSLIYPDPAGTAIEVEAGTTVTAGREIGLVTGAPTGEEWFVFLIADSTWQPPAIEGMQVIEDWARRYAFGGADSPGQRFVQWVLGRGSDADFSGALVPVAIVR